MPGVLRVIVGFLVGVVLWPAGRERVVVAGGIDRTLRTTQWTRASARSLPSCWGVVVLWSHTPAARGVAGVCFFDSYVISSCEEQTVDAWASGAEEGRSNLR